MKSVVICGSRRFKPEIRKFATTLKKLGVTVYEPHLHSGQKEWEKLSDQYKKFTALGLTHDHIYKIRMADVVYLFNKGGYSGVSTSIEVGAALALGKPIYARAQVKDITVTNFIHAVASPFKLLKLLKSLKKLRL